MKFCSNCGAQVTGKFCQSCGKEYEEVQVAPNDDGKILNSLYLIRAGLSQISIMEEEKQECEKQIPSLDKSIDANQKRVSQRKGEISYYSKELKELKKSQEEQSQDNYQMNEIKNDIIRLKKKNEELQNLIEELENRKFGKNEIKYCIHKFIGNIDDLREETFFFHPVISTFVTILALAAFLFCVGYGMFGGDAIIHTILRYVGIIGIAMIALVLISFVIAKITYNNLTVLPSKFHISKYQEEIKNNKAAMSVIQNTKDDFAKNSKNKYEIRIEQLEKSLKYYRDNLDTSETNLNISVEKKEECLDIIKNNSEKSGIIYDMLVQRFGSQISPLDWGNLDILIYLFETNRVNTIQEALRELDTMKRHEDLKNVIGEASANISNSISHFASSISFKMDEIVDAHNNLADNLNGGLKSINDSMKFSAEMQEALLKKSNESSQKLMEDVRRMRNIADQDAVKRGYI